jgi:hypothetical protein
MVGGYDMKKSKHTLNKIFCMLVTIIFLFLSTSNSFQHPTIAEPSMLPPIIVEKLVWNETSYDKSTVVNEGDIVQFKVIIYNPYDEYEIHWSGIIYDILPCNLEYMLGSATLPLEEDHPDLEPEQYFEGNNTVIWQVDRESPILPHHYFNFTYNAIAVCCGSGYLSNFLTVSPDTLVHFCDPSDVI